MRLPTCLYWSRQNSGTTPIPHALKTRLVDVSHDPFEHLYDSTRLSRRTWHASTASHTTQLREMDIVIVVSWQAATIHARLLSINPICYCYE